ncbi:MAG TPA: SOS response-associated peptidase, partial [Stellaceae bacterium]|nr:SOS response-associated peptidase [Stellaceae bacterium]
MWPRPPLFRCQRDQAGVFDPARAADPEHTGQLERGADRGFARCPLRCQGRQRSLDVMRWGLVPFWAKDIKVGFANINAKAEGIDTKPAFREAFVRRRCLIPFDCFYEWKKLGKEREPYAVGLADRRLMALAGLWETWRSPAGERVRSFAIATTAANSLLAPVHDRMPVMLAPENWP